MNVNSEGSGNLLIETTTSERESNCNSNNNRTEEALRTQPSDEDNANNDAGLNVLTGTERDRALQNISTPYATGSVNGHQNEFGFDRNESHFPVGSLLSKFTKMQQKV